MEKNIATAFLAAQSEMSNPKKGSANPFFKSKYADLNSVREAVLPVLNAHGISVIQPLTTVDGKNYVKTILLHESGETIESLTEIIYTKKDDAQAQGSGITYARRYGLQSLVCVGADDDDGNAASTKQGSKKPTLAQPTGINADDIDIAIQDVKDCQSKEELQAVWRQWAAMRSDEKFKAAVVAKGKELGA